MNLVDYLADGALIDILQTSGGKNPLVTRPMAVESNASAESGTPAKLFRQMGLPELALMPRMAA